MKKSGLIIITIITVAVIVLVTFIHWRHSFEPTPRPLPPDKAQRAVCLSQMHMIDVAKTQWAEKYHKSTGDVPSWTDLQPILDTATGHAYKYPEITHCPAGGAHTIGRIGQVPTCSIPEHKLPE